MGRLCLFYLRLPQEQFLGLRKQGTKMDRMAAQAARTLWLSSDAKYVVRRPDGLGFEGWALPISPWKLMPGSKNILLCYQSKKSQEEQETRYPPGTPGIMAWKGGGWKRGPAEGAPRPRGP